MKYGAVLAMQICQRHCMHILSGAQSAIKIDFIKHPSTIGSNDGLKAEIAC